MISSSFFDFLTGSRRIMEALGVEKDKFEGFDIIAEDGLISMERRGVGGSYFIRLNVPRKVLSSF